MKAKVRKAVLRLLLLREEFTPAELREAFKAVKDDKLLAELVPSLFDDKPHRSNGLEYPPAIAELADKDKERFELLHGLGKRLQKGELLPKNESLHEFGRHLDPDFRPARSRRQSVFAILELLVDLPLDSIKSLVTKLESSTEPSAFAELARAIMGK